MDNLLCTILTCLLSVATWSSPQPAYSAGLGVVYGSQQTVEANAAFHSYDLSLYPGRCGVAAISSAMLGRVAWVRAEHGGWAVGPCLVIDVVARADAAASIYARHEVVEVSRESAALLGFAYGAPVAVFFGVCPPPADSIHYTPQAYAPELRWDVPPDDGAKSFWPYAAQETPVECP